MTPRPRLRDDHDGDGRKHERRGESSPPDRFRLERIEVREPAGPDRLHQIVEVRDERVGQPQPQRRGRERIEGPALPLGDERDRDRYRREQQEGDLLDDAPPSLERPPVEQQQDERQRDEHRLRHQAEGEGEERGEIAARRRAPGMLDPGEQREHPEERAEEVLALGDPRHRLDVQRVEAEEGRHGRASRQRARPPPQQMEKEHGAPGVKSEADQMVAAGVEREEGHVEHVREPRQRVPVGCVESGERPAQAFEAEAFAHHRVLVDVEAVVEGDEIVSPHLPEDGGRRRDQAERDEKPPGPARHRATSDRGG